MSYLSATRACELNKALADYLTKNIHPIYSVEIPGLKRLGAKLDSKYVLPSWNFSEMEIPGLYYEVRDNVVYPKKEEAEYFSSTTDLWTSCASHTYLTLTVHFVSDEDWTLQSFCLDTIPLFEGHTGQNISKAVKDIYRK